MRWSAVAVAILVAFSGDSSTVASDDTQAARPLVIEIRLENESITPITARFIGRAVESAEEQGAECLVIVLDTPGGLLDSTRSVVKTILRSEVPVVVYIAPSGARAASAGVFITLAGHVAAMAPGTNIGAAHPVALGGMPGTTRRLAEEEDDADKAPDEKKPAEEKLISDTVAWARSLAELRGRNADWAAGAVRESLSVSASTAVKEGIVDLLADDMDDLLEKIDGREVTTLRGTFSLNTADARVSQHEMWWGERVLTAVANPNVAFLLLILGFYGVLFEFYSPGWGVAGTLGAICLVMAFFALAILPVNYVGLLLIALALAMFVAEVFVTSFGALTLGGAVCLVLGGIMLVDSPAGFAGISLAVVVPVAVATAGITLFLVGSIVRTHRGTVQTGSEGLLHARAVAQESFVQHDSQYLGTVRAHGEFWTGASQTPVQAGQTLEIIGREGLTLRVRTAQPPKPGHSPDHTAAAPPS